jgi:hypothetical protein
VCSDGVTGTELGVIPALSRSWSVMDSPFARPGCYPARPDPIRGGPMTAAPVRTLTGGRIIVASSVSVRRSRTSSTV